jgi:DNA-directed RNA polymerase subunit omega
MARVTVEDCIQRVPNRFELVLLAAERARHLNAGEEPTVDRDNDKNPIIALREIAEATIDLKRLEADLIRSLVRVPEPEEPKEDQINDIVPTDQNIFGMHDVSPEEEAANAADLDELSPDELTAAIEAELSGQQNR